MPAILWSLIAFCVAGMSVRRARMPPWIAGCRVFTRPSMISGKPVWSLTSITFSPASRKRLGRAAGRQDRHAVRRQRLAELDQAGLVGDGDQRPLDLREIGRGRGDVGGGGGHGGSFRPRSGGVKAADYQASAPSSTRTLKPSALQDRDQLAHMVAAAGFDGDVELGGLGDHAAEQALVLHLDDVAAGLADERGDPGELARRVGRSSAAGARCGRRAPGRASAPRPAGGCRCCRRSARARPCGR